MTHVRKNERAALLELAALPDDDWQPEHWAVYDAARAQCRDLFRRLTAENERLREAALLVHDLVDHWAECPAPPDAGCSACHAYFAAKAELGRVAATPARQLAPLDDQTERWLERAKADAQPGPKHAAPSTGEDGGK